MPQAPVGQPAPPLSTGSGAHGLRRQVNALAGVFASKHALAECVPVRTCALLLGLWQHSRRGCMESTCGPLLSHPG